MHFFKPASAFDSSQLIKLYNTACTLVESLAAIDAATNFTSYGTVWFERGLALAASVLIRLLKSPFGEMLDADDGRRRRCLPLSAAAAAKSSPSRRPTAPTARRARSASCGAATSSCAGPTASGASSCACAPATA